MLQVDLDLLVCLGYEVGTEEGDHHKERGKRDHVQQHYPPVQPWAGEECDGIFITLQKIETE